MISPQVRSSAEPITRVLHDWLAAEVASSSDPSDVNAPLDNYEDAIKGLQGGFDPGTNFTWDKHEGHMMRLPLDFNLLAGSSPQKNEFDKVAAKVKFDALMEVSGTFRNQCYVEAQNQEDYMARRRRVIGISIGNIVTNRLIGLVPMKGGLAEARISIEGLSREVDYSIKAGTDSIKKLISIVMMGQDRQRGMEEMAKGQYVWLRLAVDSLILIAKLKNGDLSKVPFLEPRSIGEQSGKLWYPFQEPLDWAAIMAANPPALIPGKSSV